jgi:hypothetical protein
MSLEDKAMALNSFRILHVKLPVELFDIVLLSHRQDLDLFAALCFIHQLENEGFIPKKEVK